MYALIVILLNASLLRLPILVLQSISSLGGGVLVHLR